VPIGEIAMGVLEMCNESTTLGAWEVPHLCKNPAPLVFLGLFTALQQLLVVDLQ
jgi:hypothetical protein